MGSGASAGVSAAVGAASDAELAAAVAELSNESRKQVMDALVHATTYSGPKIVAQRAYFHPTMGFGEHSEVYAQTEAGVRDFCVTMSKWSTDPAHQDLVIEDLMTCFAEEGTWSVEAPVGTPAKTTANAIKESLQAKILVETLKVKDVKVAHNERHCAALIEVTCKGALSPPYHRIDIFNFNDAGKIIELQSYTHPSDSPALADPNPRTSVASQTEELVRGYAAARTKGHIDGCEAQTALFASGAFTMTDPIGTPAKTTHAEVKEFLQSLSGGRPAMTPKEIFVSADERQCAALLEIQMTAMKGQPTFSVIDTFRLEDVLKVDTFDVDASVDEVVGLLTVPSGWAKIVPGFAAEPESVMLEASQGFRMTTMQNNWMWVTDLAPREGLLSVRITVTDPEEDPGPRPKKKLFTVIQTWTLTPKGRGCTIERKFIEYDGSETLRGFLVGGMIDKENKLVVETLASKS